MTWLSSVQAAVPRLTGLPPRYAGSKFSQLPEGPIAAAVDSYCRKFEQVGEQGLAPVFLGRAQQYKTFGAALIAREIHTRYSLDVGWINATRFMTEDFEGVRTLVTRAARLPFVVIDDFNAVTSDYAKGQLIALASQRFDALLPTCWTGNVAFDRRAPWAGLEAQWGPTFARRLQEGGKGFTVFVV